jgi:hypothetical protein
MKSVKDLYKKWKRKKASGEIVDDSECIEKGDSARDTTTTVPGALLSGAEAEYERIASELITYSTTYSESGKTGKQSVSNLGKEGTESWYSGKDVGHDPVIRMELLKPQRIHRYSISSANDCSERYPSAWGLFGLSSGSLT